jgi:hypothetical protein
VFSGDLDGLSVVGARLLTPLGLLLVGLMLGDCDWSSLGFEVGKSYELSVGATELLELGVEVVALGDTVVGLSFGKTVGFGTGISDESTSDGSCEGEYNTDGFSSTEGTLV